MHNWTGIVASFLFSLTLLLPFLKPAKSGDYVPPQAYGWQEVQVITVSQVHQTSQPKSPKIRFVVLKHSKESMADGDANLAIQSVEKARAAGLDIKVIGNHYINTMKAPEIRTFCAELMKKDASPGDTLVIHTIGHGYGGGGLHNIGQRSEVMRAMAEAAEACDQETLWWQLSCHAAAKLPLISSLTDRQQRLFSVYCSSHASQTSPTREQANLMGKVFLGMAEGKVDTNQDGNITAEELSDFLNTCDSRKRGELLFARSRDEQIFGLLYRIILPVVDRNNPQGVYPDDYFLIPGR